jgi:hypothetical protein
MRALLTLNMVLKATGVSATFAFVGGGFVKTQSQFHSMNSNN